MPKDHAGWSWGWWYQTMVSESVQTGLHVQSLSICMATFLWDICECLGISRGVTACDCSLLPHGFPRWQGRLQPWHLEELKNKTKKNQCSLSLLPPTAVFKP